jgi:hypothetical protein
VSLFIYLFILGYNNVKLFRFPHPPMHLGPVRGPRNILARSRPTRPSLWVRPGSMDPAPTRPTSLRI